MNDDLISRAAAFDSVEIFLKQTDAPEVYLGLIPALERVINNVPSAQQERIQNNSVHLCDSCQYTYAACPSHGNDAVFGDGKGNDNICACNKYRPISAQPDGWLEQNKDKILQAGMEGREIDFRIGGRLFAIREKAQ